MTELSGIQQAIQKLAENTVKDQASTGGQPAAASAGDVEKLQAALNQQPGAANGADKVDAADKATAASDANSPGARILDHMNNLRTSFDSAIKDLNSVIASASDSPSELIKVQLKLQQVTMQQDLLGKVTSKSEQNIETLLKGQ